MTAIPRDRSDQIVHPVGTVNLQDQFLTDLAEGRVPVCIFLINGIRLQGEIESYDQYGIVLRGGSNQFVYKHAISTILPGRIVTHANQSGDGAHVVVRATTLHGRKPRP